MYRLIGLIAFVCLVSCSSSKNKLTEWQALFDGKSLKNWTVKIHHHKVGDNYGETFRVKDNNIQVRYDRYDGFKDRFGHLYYNTPFSSFHLKLEYKFTGMWHPESPKYTVLNSGVMFHSQDPRTMLVEQDWPISVEMQFLAGLPDGKPRPTGNMCSPGTDIVYEGKVDPRHCIDSKSKTYLPETWVKAELIVIRDEIVKHIIEGDTVLIYNKPTIGGGVATGFDPKYKIDGKALTSGHIALQSEGQEIDFRNIMIKKL